MKEAVLVEPWRAAVRAEFKSTAHEGIDGLGCCSGRISGRREGGDGAREVCDKVFMRLREPRIQFKSQSSDAQSGGGRVHRLMGGALQTDAPPDTTLWFWARDRHRDTQT